MEVIMTGHTLEVEVGVSFLFLSQMCPGAEDALLQAPEVADLWVSIFLVWMST
jgi:hypothetical protein